MTQGVAKTQHGKSKLHGFIEELLNLVPPFSQQVAPQILLALLGISKFNY